jgi:hypothetical protein
MMMGDKIRQCLAEDPNMPTAEIVRRTGARMNYVSTLRWKEKNYDRWRMAHAAQARRAHRRTNGVPT